jgi:hypothetical protein
MRLLIHPRATVADPEVRVQIVEALETAFGPVRSRLDGIDVYLTDVNGPRGGPDKRCRAAGGGEPDGPGSRGGGHRGRGPVPPVRQTLPQDAAGPPGAVGRGVIPNCVDSLLSPETRPFRGGLPK